MGDFDKFQQNVGRAGADFGLISSYFVGGFLVIGAVICIILNFTQSNSQSGSGQYCSQDSDCVFTGETCQNKQCLSHQPDQKPPYLIIAAGCIVFALIIVLYSRWYNKWVHKSDDNAKIGGYLTEGSFLLNMMNKH